MNSRTIAASIVLATALSSATALASADAATNDHATATARAGSFQVTTKVDKTEPLLDTKVKIKGAVSPAAPGATVTLQVRYEDRNEWKTIASARLNSASKYKFKDKVSSVRVRKYRVLKAAGANRSAGHSPAVKVTVFGWRNLTSLDAVLAAAMYETDVTVNGTNYPASIASYNSVQPPGPNHIDYNLNRDCKSLEARYGISDSSPATGTATLALLADNVGKYSGTFGLTQSELVTTDVSNVFRITVNSTVTNGGIAAVASPRVLCSF